LTKEGLEGIEELVGILDMDQDGRVTAADFQAFVMKYMMNNGITSSKNGIFAGFEKNMDAERIINSGETELDKILLRNQTEAASNIDLDVSNPYLLQKSTLDTQYSKYFSPEKSAASELTQTTAFNDLKNFSTFQDLTPQKKNLSTKPDVLTPV
jgi:hypothetical protein